MMKHLSIFRQIDENQDLCDIFCFITMIILVSTYFYIPDPKKFIIKGVLWTNSAAAIFCVLYFTFKFLFNKRHISNILFFLVLFISLPFASYYMLFIFNFENKWVVKLVVSLSLLYIYTNLTGFVLLNVLGLIMSYALYTTLSKYYPISNYDQHSLLFFKGRGYMSFSNGAFTILLAILLLLKAKLEYLKFEISKSFTNAIAHELYSPVSIIQIKNLGIIEEAKKDGENNQILPKLEECNHLLKSCLRSIEMILTASKEINKEHNITTEKKYSLAKYVNRALDEYYLSEAEKKLITFDQSTDINFYGNPHLLKHVIFNLLKNTFTHAGKNVNIEIWIDAKRNELHYKDYGIGIKKENIGKIFSDKFTTNGFGIGMHFSKNVLEKMNAEIRCASIYQEYTEFIIKFPRV